MQRSRQSLYSEKVEFVKEQFSHILPNMIYRYNHFLLVESFKGESNLTNKISIHAFQKFSQPNNHLNLEIICDDIGTFSTFVKDLSTYIIFNFIVFIDKNNFARLAIVT